MKESKLTTQIRQIAKNTSRLFKLAWRIDKRTTILYYLTAAIGALVPVASGYVLKLLIDPLQLIKNISRCHNPCHCCCYSCRSISCSSFRRSYLQWPTSKLL